MREHLHSALLDFQECILAFLEPENLLQDRVEFEYGSGAGRGNFHLASAGRDQEGS